MTDRREGRVVVVGAGLAGLVAGHELRRRGHEVVLLEARARPGGRVVTLREPFADGLYAEGGAIGISESHDWSLRYVRDFDLSLEPAFPDAARVLYLAGADRIPVEAAPLDAPSVALSPEERALGLGGMFAKYFGPALAELGTPTGLDATSPAFAAYAGTSLEAYLTGQGASAGAVSLLRLGLFDAYGDGIGSYAAATALRAEFFNPRWFRIAGGSDRLPYAIAATLSDEIRYGAPVVRIEHDRESARVICRQGAAYESVAADYVVCTLPFSVLRHVEIAPVLGPEKRHAVDRLGYTSASRVLLQASVATWGADLGGGMGLALEDGVQWWDQAPWSSGARAVLQTSTTGETARRLDRLDERERLRWAIDRADATFPGTQSAVETGCSISWDDDEWARGGYSWLAPGEPVSLWPHCATPEGRIHFAGEHTSAWPATMQGAIESGHRAALEVHAAYGGANA